MSGSIENLLYFTPHPVEQRNTDLASEQCVFCRDDLDSQSEQLVSHGYLDRSVGKTRYHIFHRKCLIEWYIQPNSSASCPKCLQKVNVDALFTRQERIGKSIAHNAGIIGKLMNSAILLAIPYIGGSLASAYSSSPEAEKIYYIATSFILAIPCAFSGFSVILGRDSEEFVESLTEMLPERIQQNGTFNQLIKPALNEWTSHFVHLGNRIQNSVTRSIEQLGNFLFNR